MFEFQSVRRSFPRNLAENSEAASFLDQTTSFETVVQEREPWDFYEWSLRLPYTFLSVGSPFIEEEGKMP